VRRISIAALVLSACSFPGAAPEGEQGTDAAATDAAPSGDAADLIDAPWSVQTLSFRHNVNGYVGSIDTHINELARDQPHGAETNVISDLSYQDSEEQWGLIAFHQIFGPGPMQIPENAIIRLATLEILVYDEGQELGFHRALRTWNEDAVWNEFGQQETDAPESGVDYLADATDSVPQDFVDSSPFGLLVTADLTAWLAEPGTNFGWVVRPNGGNSVQFYSREHDRAAERPRLTVEFEAP